MWKAKKARMSQGHERVNGATFICQPAAATSSNSLWLMYLVTNTNISRNWQPRRRGAALDHWTTCLFVNTRRLLFQYLMEARRETSSAFRHPGQTNTRSKATEDNEASLYIWICLHSTCRTCTLALPVTARNEPESARMGGRPDGLVPHRLTAVAPPPSLSFSFLHETSLSLADCVFKRSPCVSSSTSELVS